MPAQSKFECDVCLDYFSSKYNLERHQSTHLEEIKYFKCPYCSVEYVRLNDLLNKHVKSVHPGCEETLRRNKDFVPFRFHHNKAYSKGSNKTRDSSESDSGRKEEKKDMGKKDRKEVERKEEKKDIAKNDRRDVERKEEKKDSAKKDRKEAERKEERKDTVKKERKEGVRKEEKKDSKSHSKETKDKKRARSEDGEGKGIKLKIKKVGTSENLRVEVPNEKDEDTEVVIDDVGLSAEICDELEKFIGMGPDMQFSPPKTVNEDVRIVTKKPLIASPSSPVRPASTVSSNMC